MKRTITTAIVALLLSGAWVTAQAQNDAPATAPVATAPAPNAPAKDAPTTIQATAQQRAVEVQVEPAAGHASGTGTVTITGQVAAPAGTAAPMAVPSGGAVFMTPGVPAVAVPAGGVFAVEAGPDAAPNVKKRVFIRRVGGGPDMPGPATMPFPGGGLEDRMYVATATATLAGKAEKTAFLGVVATRVSPTLRSQLKLKAGLVIDNVEPKSSAEAAGLQVHDIVEKCDNQWLINPAQFIGLVRMYKPGDSVTLTVLREGERKKITAKLEERETYAVEEGQDFLYSRATPFNPNNQPGAVAVFTRPVEGFGGPVQQITAGALGSAPLVPGLVATFGDDKQQLLITIRDGHQFLTAKDPSGKQIFDGPIDTPEQRKAVPAAVLKQLEEMEKIKVKIRTGAPASGTLDPLPVRP